MVPTTYTNRLLACLSTNSQLLVSTHLEPIPLPVRTPLSESLHQPKFVYFMTAGVASTVIDLEDGGSIEVGLVGLEGMVGAMHLLGPGPIVTRTFIQMEGAAYRMPMAVIQRLFSENVEIRGRVLEVAQQQSATLSTLAACNRMHSAEERLSRWLLMTSDRVGSETLTLTQEFMAEMLGTQRTTLAGVASSLQEKGFIEYRRGVLNIISRPMLEKHVCECYAVTKRSIESLYKEPVST